MNAARSLEGGGRRCRRSLAAAFVLLACFLAGRVASAATPHSEDVKAAIRIVERWLRVQGLDRVRAQIYPRDVGYVIESGTPAQTTKVRFIDSGEAPYWLALEAPGGLRHGEISERTGSYWFISEGLGLGLIREPSQLVGSLRRSRAESQHVWATFNRWQQLPDQHAEGKGYQVVAASRAGDAAVEYWWFEPGTGVRVRADVVVGGELTQRTRWGDFRRIGDILEPFEILDGDGPQQATIRIVKVANQVNVPANFFAPTPAQVAMWWRTEAVLEKFVKATGGTLALARVVSRVTRCTGENIGTGVRFELTQWQKAVPDRFLIETSTHGLGRSWQGFDGHKGWEYSDLKGFRSMSGGEAELFRRNGALDLENIRRNYPIRKFHGTKEGERTQDGRAGAR
jgi:hypothetical protein